MFYFIAVIYIVLYLVLFNQNKIFHLFPGNGNGGVTAGIRSQYILCISEINGMQGEIDGCRILYSGSFESETFVWVFQVRFE